MLELVRQISTHSAQPGPKNVPTRASLQKALGVLGLSEACTEGDIKHAFQTMVKRCHPDSSEDHAATSERMTALTEAYRLLRQTSPELRRDVLLHGSASPTRNTQEKAAHERAMKFYHGKKRSGASPKASEHLISTASFNLRERPETAIPKGATYATGRPCDLEKLRFAQQLYQQQCWFSTSSARRAPASQPPASSSTPRSNDFGLNPAPWINQRRHEDIFKSKSSSMMQRYWALCGPPLVFLFSAWGVWWYFFLKRRIHAADSSEADGKSEKKS